VWEALAPRLRECDFAWTVRRVAELTGLSTGAVCGTLAWKIYRHARLTEKIARIEQLREDARCVDFL
jgi:hypothetical protein